MRKFLGTANVYGKYFRTFTQARKFARSIKLKSAVEWRQYTKGEFKHKKKFPYDMPKDPYSTYKDKGWTNWGNFLGTNNLASQNRVYQSFNQARKFARSLKLKDEAEWRHYTKREFKHKKKIPADIPKDPRVIYKDKSWTSMGDFLGTANVAPKNRVYRSFNQAKKFVKSLKLKNEMEWRHYTKGKFKHKKKLPTDIPKDPRNTYKYKSWTNMGDFLGTDNIAPKNRVFRSFNQAKKFIKSLNLKNETEWKQYTKGEFKHKKKLPADIPKDPYNTYKDKAWTGMKNFLGTARKKIKN